MRASTVRRAIPQWFVGWFDSPHYQKLYADRSDGEAAAFVDALIDRLRPAEGANVLDLGCGTGRHARRLAEKGLRVTGLDLAAASIRAAKRLPRRGLRFARHDMRVPFGQNAFDYVFSFFTSFGYFDTAAEHLGVLGNMATALRPGGTLVLDYLNVRCAEARLVAEEARTINGITYEITRWSDAQHLRKRIVAHLGPRRAVEYEERVAKFTLDEFRTLSRCVGFRLERVFGDYALGVHDPVSSPRTIMVARNVRHESLASGETLPDAAEGLRREAEIRRQHPLWYA